MRLFFTFFLFGMHLVILSQPDNRITISGYITDKSSGEALIGATVYNPLAGNGTSANSYGFYSLSVPAADSISLRFSYVSYLPVIMQLPATSNLTLNVEMESRTELQQVEVSADRGEEEFERSQMSSIDISLEKVKNLPVLLGERDVMKTIQLMPGVQSGNEGTSGLYVRGGGPDQNLILLDGVPIYNASHLFGFFSVFNPDALNSVSLIKGGFPAEYGGRLSSVIDMHMKEGNMKEIHGEGSVGIISAKLLLEGPIVKDKTSFMISGRRTYIDALTRPLIAANTDGTATGGYYFYDLNAKINHRFSDKSRLFLSGYMGNDKFYARNNDKWSRDGIRYEESFETRLQWGNRIAALRWNYIFGPRLFSNTTITYSRYQFLVGNESQYSSSEPDNSEYNIQYDSGIQDYSGKIDFNFVPNPDHYIKFGSGYTFHEFNPGISSISNQITNFELDTAFGSDKIFASEFWSYIQDDVKISEKLKVNAGLHFSGFILSNKSYFALQPRFSGRYLLSDKMSVKASYARMAQYLHLLTNVGVGLPTDLWVPPTENIKPQFAHQVALGLSRKMGNMLDVSLEGYYKKMDNLIEYKDGASFISINTDWESKVEAGEGWSYGGELLIEKKEGKTTGWIGYTLSWANRQFENLNFGEVFPYRYDRRHDISLAVTHKFNQRVDVGLVWVYGTGNAVSLSTERQITDPLNSSRQYSEVDYYESRNNYRMPSYHRLDLGVNLHKETRYGERTWSFGVYNGYNRQNPFMLYFSRNNAGDSRLTQLSLFPLLPSISYSFKF